METIVLKIIICSGILLGCYHLFLAKEKTFVFNRFFLIFALIFSYVVPFMTIKTQQKAPTEKIFFEDENTLQTVSYTPITVSEQSFDYTSLILPVYLLISGILLCKLLFSIYKIKSLKGSKIIYKNRVIKVLENNMPPFSFMNTIYISKDYFKDGKIENSIFLHEEIHVKQKHTADVLFTEILKILLWFNPFVYFYKRAMVTNHEFIADEQVIYKNKNIKTYQELILKEILKQQDLNLIHQFNFNNTKKRFIMMTSKNSKFAKAKKYLTIPAFTALTLIFAEKVYANNMPETENQNSNSLQSADNTTKAYNAQKNTDTDFRVQQEGLPNDLKSDTTPKKTQITAKLQEIKSTNDDNTVKDLAVAPPAAPVENFVQAEFPGGNHELRKQFGNAFNSSVFGKNEKGNMKADIYISIDENGKTTDIKADGNTPTLNNEAVRTMKEVVNNKTWKPATENGKPVPTAFKLPVSFNIQ
ncbi:M56 family metallopeptidase [Chryseobacterium sp. Y16C]|uniref:M56 family metallopeptidase n=1 Tax=Chryseobacterium sp. Y16C TaxID=2920939 RepID=UPI001F0A48FB|nr:M56 family metallopeptidase [Chryseobacterium sp. Y16C]UMQ40769.1 M56 family metallopeptidase [Chryseobacterium sp. Y16C]